MLNRETLAFDLMVEDPNGEFGPQCPIEYVEWVKYGTCFWVCAEEFEEQHS